MPVRFLDLAMKTAWEVDIPDWMPPALSNAVRDHDLAVAYGGEGRRSKVYSFLDMIKDALNYKQPDLSWSEKIGDETIKHPEEQATIAARENIQILKERWKDWIAQDPARVADLTKTFNDRYNRTKLRDWDPGPLQEALRRGGLALPFDYYRHQLRAIWRALIGGNTLVAHHVGAGKTFEAISIAMMWRKTGRARKPMITVPPDTLSSWRKHIMEAYPSAKVLIFDTADLKAGRRQQSMARIAYGDWDLVVVPHSSFELMSVSKARMERMIGDWMDEIRDAAFEAASSDKEAEKQIARMQTKLEQILEDVRKGSDENLMWEGLGVDALIVDEAHKFKNLFYFTKIENVQGISKAESRRALDLFVKVQRINEASNYRNLVFLTATPIMNSPAEIFHLQRYLQPQALEEQSITDFDSWAGMFLQPGPGRVQKPDGSYKEVTQIKGYNNLFTLWQTVMRAADYVGPDDPDMPKVPEIEGGEVETINVPKHPIYDTTLQPWFVARMQELKRNPPGMRDGEYEAPYRTHPITGAETERWDNHLTVMGDARLAAVDPRLILNLEHVDDFEGSRVKRAADLVTEFYAKTTEATYDNDGKMLTPDKGVAMIFLDVGTPKKPPPLAFLEGAEAQGTVEEKEQQDADDKDAGESGIVTSRVDLYEAIKQELIGRGIPEKEIAYVHQANKLVERQALTDAVNAGKVRVLFGSTSRGGEGINVQTRLGMMLHIDVPKAMRPGDLLQRNGRIVRASNLFQKVRIVRFVTRGSTDEWLYSRLIAKQGWIFDFWNGAINTFEDKERTADNLEEAQKLATGDPRALRLLDLKDEETKLRAQAENEERQRLRAAEDVRRYEGTVKYQKRKLKEQTAFQEAKVPAEKLIGDDFKLVIDGTEYTGVGNANKAIIEMMRTVHETDKEAVVAVALGDIAMQMALKPHMHLAYVVDGEKRTERYVSGGIYTTDEDGAYRVALFDSTDGYNIRPAAVVQAWINGFRVYTRELAKDVEQSERDLERARAAYEARGGTSDKRDQLRTISKEINTIEMAFLEETRQRDIAAGAEPGAPPAEPAPAEDDDDAPEPMYPRAHGRARRPGAYRDPAGAGRNGRRRRGDGVAARDAGDRAARPATWAARSTCGTTDAPRGCSTLGRAASRSSRPCSERIGGASSPRSSRTRSAIWWTGSPTSS